MQAQFESQFSDWYSKKQYKYILESSEAYQARLSAIQKAETGVEMTREEHMWAARNNLG